MLIQPPLSLLARVFACDL